MEYTVLEVRNVLRNYESLLVRKKGDQGKDEPVNPALAKVDDVRISREALEKFIELKRADASYSQEQVTL
jgi:hypothetical protein